MNYYIPALVLSTLGIPAQGFPLCMELSWLPASCAGERGPAISVSLQIITALEEDPTAQKMQLGYRLQQIAAAVENKVTDL